MDLKVGILIIGSLFWDNIYGRDDWRRDFLLMDDVVDVHAPIRYGRFSKSRQAYTMLFSSSAGPGRAKVVACANRIRKAGDLVAEAERLWKAEDNKDNQITSNWGGCVVLCVNKNRTTKEHSQVIEAWEQRVSKEPGVYSHFPKSPDDDKNLVSPKGHLDLWPKTVSGQELDFDFLLATANYPFKPSEPCSYPDARKIADAWLNRRNELPYFTKNCAHGIRTFQDDAIVQALSTECDPLSC